jgi:hypothetical protein
VVKFCIADDTGSDNGRSVNTAPFAANTSAPETVGWILLLKLPIWGLMPL